jgi:hypothetical protein
MAGFKVAIEGFQELKDVLDELNRDFGPKDAKNILVSAVRKAMRVVLDQARTMVPVDTGALKASLRIEARKPTSKDKRSKYVSATDTAIATVTTAPGKVLAKRKYYNVKQGKHVVGIQSDARAVAMEFGTAHVAARPYLRPSLEGQSSTVVSDLANQISQSIVRYQARQAKRKTL